MNTGERKFCNFQYHYSGDFYKFFWGAAMKADKENLARLKKGFPEEIEALLKYRLEPGYWDDLEEEYLKKTEKEGLNKESKLDLEMY